jgi:hypothetical protein
MYARAKGIRVPRLGQADERHVFRRPPVAAEDDFHRSAGGPVESHTWKIEFESVTPG